MKIFSIFLLKPITVLSLAGKVWVYVEEGLSGKRNRALLARDSNTCDLSQELHTHCNCKPFFFWLEHSS